MKIISVFHDISEQKRILLIFMIALALRIGISLYMGSNQFAYENGEIASNLLAGNGFSFEAFPPATSLQETCFMAPFYPYFIAVIVALFGSVSIGFLVIQVIQSFIGASTIILVYYLAREFFDSNTSFLSALVTACYPDFVVSSYVIHQLVFTTFFVVLSILCTVRLQKRPDYRIGSLCGFVYGTSLYVNPSTVSIIALLWFWVALSKVQNQMTGDSEKLRMIKKSPLILLTVVLVCGLLIIPWEVRCISIQNRLVFMKDSGFNLWRGNNPEYTDTGIPSWFDESYLDSLNSTSEAIIDTNFMEAASSYMITHIPETMTNIIRKIVEFWWFPNILPEQSPIIRKMLYSPLLMLSIIGLSMERKRVHEFLPLLLPLLGFTMLYSLTFVLPRYRVPVQPIVSIFASLAFLRVWKLIVNHFQTNDA